MNYQCNVVIKKKKLHMRIVEKCDGCIWSLQAYVSKLV